MKAHGVRLLLVGIAVAGGPVAVSKGEGNACQKTSHAALNGCQRDARADYWIALGKCDNEPVPADRMMCKVEAAVERDAALEECNDQFDARQEACDDLGGAPYHPKIDPADFVAEIDNPYFPLMPGTTFIYEGQTAEGLERVEFAVTHDIKVIQGVACVQIRDIVTLNGDVIEDTLDWFAQDKDGNVWYMGENVNDYEGGRVVSVAGSWVVGADGAAPGIIMKAQPQVGELYRQEFLLGEAEDLAEVLSLTESVAVPYGSFDDCLKTADFTPLEPDALEHKYYASGVGQIMTVNVTTGDRIKLIEITQ